MEFFHVQTHQSFPLLTQYQTIKIGKFTEAEPQNINLINIPNEDIISRLHLYVYPSLSSKVFEIEDQSSSNGTFLNGKQLIAFQRYAIKHGDFINLGKEGKVTLVFRQETTMETINRIQESIDPPNKTSLPKTEVQVETKNQSKESINVDTSLFSIDQLKSNLNPHVSRFLGIAFLIAGIIYFSATMSFGISFNAYVLILWGLGGYLLFQKNIPKEWGWLLIAAGILIMLVRGRIYAFANLLELLISFGLFYLSYFFFDNSTPE